MPAVVRAPLHLPRARGLVAVALLTVAALLIPAASASAGLLAPDAGPTQNAEEIRSLYWMIFWIAVVIFVAVEGILLYSIVKFRARKGAVAAQVHGSTRLEITWTVGAALILVVLAVVTFSKLGAIEDPPATSADGLRLDPARFQFAGDNDRQRLPEDGKSLNIVVNGQQYVWRYTYPDGDKNNINNVFSYEEMVVPTNTTVTLEIKAQDVQHSWWIPKLGGKFDAVPGYTNYTWFKITEPGVWTGQCAELCGRNHANMTARVRALPPAEFEAWYARQKAQITEADRKAAAERNAIDARNKLLLERARKAQAATAEGAAAAEATPDTTP